MQQEPLPEQRDAVRHCPDAAADAGSRSEKTSSVGRHVLADLYGVAETPCGDEQGLVSLLVDALRAAGFSIVDTLSHTFPGAHAGVTAVVLLSESHAALHTYPERNYIALDVFSCGTADPEAVLETIVRTLRPQRVERTVCVRGADSRAGENETGERR